MAAIAIIQHGAGPGRPGAIAIRKLHFLAGVLISAVALYLALRDVHWREVGHAIGSANYALLVVAVAVFVVTMLFRAYRWRLLLQSGGTVRLSRLFGCLNVAYLINNVLPFQMGDFVRSYLLAELENVSSVRTLSTVIVERVLDVLALLLLLLCLVPFVSIPAWARAPSLTIAAGASLALVLLVAAAAHNATALRLVERLLLRVPERAQPKLRQMASSALDGLAVLTRPAEAVALFALTIATWLVVACVLYLVIEAVHVDAGFDAAVFVVIATTFGIFVPSSPGAFGVYHAIAISVLTSVFSVDKNAAVSFALVGHLVIYLPPIFIGTAFLWQERSVWRRVSLWRKFGELRGEVAGGTL